MLIYFVAPVAYLMGFLAQEARYNDKPIAAIICVIIYFAMYFLSINKYDK